MVKADDELAMAIEDAISGSKTFLEAFDKVVEWQKNNRDLIGFHVSTPLDILCGQRKVEDPGDEANKIAHAALNMLLESARGQLEEVDVTNEVL